MIFKKLAHCPVNDSNLEVTRIHGTKCLVNEGQVQAHILVSDWPKIEKNKGLVDERANAKMARSRLVESLFEPFLAYFKGK